MPIETEISLELLNKEAVAAKLDISQRTLNEWLATGKIPYIRVGGIIRFSWPRVCEALAKYEVREQEPSPPISALESGRITKQTKHN
jgi:excisionase family DNA binding protein